MYNGEKAISEDQKEVLLKEHFMSMEKRYQRGKIITATIAITNIFFTVISNIVGSFNIITVIVQIALSVALFKGVRWVKWLFIVGSVLTAVIAPFLFFKSAEIVVDMGSSAEQAKLIWVIVIMVLSVMQAVAGGVLLAFNKGVSEFLYNQRVKK